MKDKNLRILSPIQLIVVGILDIAVIVLGIIAIKNIIIFASMQNIFFLACEVIALIVAILTTKEILSHGVIFRDDEFEFTGIDENNLFEYESITGISAEKDEAPSFVKNMLDREACITFSLKNEQIITINLGFTTKNTLQKICDEICVRSGIEKINVNTNPAKKKKKKADKKSDIPTESIEQNEKE